MDAVEKAYTGIDEGFSPLVTGRPRLRMNAYLSMIKYPRCKPPEVLYLPVSSRRTLRSKSLLADDGRSGGVP